MLLLFLNLFLVWIIKQLVGKGTFDVVFWRWFHGEARIATKCKFYSFTTAVTSLVSIRRTRFSHRISLALPACCKKETKWQLLSSALLTFLPLEKIPKLRAHHRFKVALKDQFIYFFSSNSFVIVSVQFLKNVLCKRSPFSWINLAVGNPWHQAFVALLQMRWDIIAWQYNHDLLHFFHFLAKFDSVFFPFWICTFQSHILNFL